MHMPGKHRIHPVLVQRLFHGLHHVIHLVLMRLVTVVPAENETLMSRLVTIP